jgi:hypothetical protein
MSFSSWLLEVDFSQTEKEITACKAKQIQKREICITLYCISSYSFRA